MRAERITTEVEFSVKLDLRELELLEQLVFSYDRHQYAQFFGDQELGDFVDKLISAFMP